MDLLCDRGLVSVVLTGGEPLTCEYIYELMDYIASRGLKIQLLTNGYLFDENSIKKISKYKNLIVQVSLDGSNAISNGIQREEGSFERTVSNIKLLVKYNIEVIVAMVLNRTNIADIYNNSMFKLCEKMNVDVLAITPTVIKIANALENQSDFLDAKEALAAIKYIKTYIKQTRKKLIINISAPPALVEDRSISMIRKERPRCRRGTNSFSIRPNGDVYVCSDFMEIGYEEYELGNILMGDFEEILNRLNLIKIEKHQQLKKIKGVCSICKELPYCGGACRAAAYAQYGNILAPYPLCQELYDIGSFPNQYIEDSKIYVQYVRGKE